MTGNGLGLDFGGLTGCLLNKDSDFSATSMTLDK